MTPRSPQCRAHRLSLSASLDGAASRSELLAAEAHLLSCAECRSFRDGLTRLDVVVARAEVPAAPDLAADLDPPPPVRRRTSSRDWSLVRSLLAVVALTQIVVSAPALLWGRGTPDVHDSRHLGAWAVAFGVGLLVAAARPRHASALVPVAATLAVAVLAAAVADLVAGRQGVLPEAVHVLELLGVALLVLVARDARRSAPLDAARGATALRPA
jgi:predicted anti-sigma-YlaC factor YlaD